MNETKTIRKWFWVWDFEKEERWLNEMAMNGWILVSVGWCRYTFQRCEPGAFTLRLEMHPVDDAYIDFLQDTGVICIGRVLQWIYLCKPAEAGPFDLFSDLDSRIAHLKRIAKMLTAIGVANLLIGFSNTINISSLGVINLLAATLLMYGLGRIHGKIEALENDRELRE